jgi:hypothetical protein
MTLDELIEHLQEARKSAGADLPVRLVFRRNGLGQQHDCIGVELTEGLHGYMMLVFAGENAAEMDWPE